VRLGDPEWGLVTVDAQVHPGLAGEGRGTGVHDLGALGDRREVGIAQGLEPSGVREAVRVDIEDPVHVLHQVALGSTKLGGKEDRRESEVPRPRVSVSPSRRRSAWKPVTTGSPRRGGGRAAGEGEVVQHPGAEFTGRDEPSLAAAQGAGSMALECDRGREQCRGVIFACGEESVLLARAPGGELGLTAWWNCWRR